MSTHNMPMLEEFPGIVYRCKDGHIADITKDFNRITILDEE